jgi:hypothetical protein
MTQHMDSDPPASRPARGAHSADPSLPLLLRLRRNVSAWAAERASHQIETPYSGPAAQAASDIENLIGRLYPEVWHEQLGEWWETEFRQSHNPRFPVEHCGICRAIAAHAGLHIDRTQGAE